MQRSDDIGSRILGKAGFGIRRALRRRYGSPEDVEKAVRELAENEKLLEAWATDVNGEVFRFADMPARMREAAVLTMAMAMLQHRARTERGAA